MGSISYIDNTKPSICNFSSITTLNEIINQATGNKNIGVINGSFTSVATTALGINADALLNAMSQVISRTIFSIRPYNRKFAGLFVDNMKWGNHVRKINIGDKDWETNVSYDLVDGKSIDADIVSKPDILQTNFYGQCVYSKHYTIFRDQLNIALQNEAEFERFYTMLVQNTMDMIEQCHENTARATICNLIGGKVKGDTLNVIHLVTEYNDVTGLELNTDTVKKPENFVPFYKWAFSRIKTISGLMTERSLQYHINVTGHNIMRHTPVQNQRLYLYTPEMNNVESSVFSSVFNEQYLKMMDYEGVNFWQSIKTPMGITVNSKYMSIDGSIKEDSTEGGTATSNIFGVLMDEEAAGITTYGARTATTPYNARGEYTNVWFHFNDRYWNDFTENAVVFLLD
jgi:hypothetical protein